MLARKNQETVGHSLPEKWTKEVAELMRTVYKADCQKFNKDFQVFARSFPDELLLLISLTTPADDNALPVTLCISVDLEKEMKPEKVLNNLIDTAGLFFESYFSTPDWDDYQANWTEAEVKKIKFYYCVSRENVAITLMAEELLKKDQVSS